MNRIAKLQIDSNQGSADAWTVFAEHRRRVAEIILDSAPASQSRLCVLGAGNCNDLDLKKLTERFAEVHLIDLDGVALEAGVGRQGVADRTTLICHGGIDLTGMLDAISNWSPESRIDDPILQRCIEEPAKTVEAVVPGQFEVVASTCVLSQLIGAVVHSAGERHSRFLELVQAVRLGHLRLLAKLVAPGGVVAFISDFVSSDSFPTLTTIDDESLSGAIAQLIRDRNFFHGMNPNILVSLFRDDAVLREAFSELKVLPPWRWNLGRRQYAVFGIKLWAKPTINPHNATGLP